MSFCIDMYVCMQTITTRSRYGTVQQVQRKNIHVCTAENPLKSVPPHIAMMFCTYTMADPSTQGERRISTHLCNGAVAVALHHVYHGTSSVLCALHLPWPFSSKPSAFGSPLALRQLVWLQQLQCLNLAREKRSRVAAAAAEPQTLTWLQELQSCRRSLIEQPRWTQCSKQ